ncbi:hypothetical protein [Janthinobacterium sp. JC611]|uniref:hypothetical protein n=1 Tax=Janthinobacterium sp. JC611 TaxID=2816201 RepID=UPI001BFE042B|nr:hypothetical protein [Janthinobacterium sp. JC611]
MLRLFKTWLILLLIAAVPLQAATAGAMRRCAGSPAVAVAAACQHHAAPSAAEENTPPAKHACGACASCCLGALMAPGPALPAAACIGAQRVTITTPTLLTGFIPDGPRRPPRPLSA